MRDDRLALQLGLGVVAERGEDERRPNDERLVHLIDGDRRHGGRGRRRHGCKNRDDDYTDTALKRLSPGTQPENSLSLHGRIAGNCSSSFIIGPTYVHRRAPAGRRRLTADELRRRVVVGVVLAE